MRILVDEDAITGAQKAFEQAVSSVADERIQTDIGHPNGHLEAQAYWVSSVGLWAYFGLPPDEKSPGKRYWNVFGLEKPSDSVSIMCEINPPVRGIDRRPAGAFAEAGGELYVLHPWQLQTHFADGFRMPSHVLTLTVLGFQPPMEIGIPNS